MERRYQVFVSSTFEDLKAEREGVLRALLAVDAFPSSMEGFGAASVTPWDIITATIDLCDYYLLITAGKYGSVDGTGISYTEKEYDYALAKGIPCLAFVHSTPTKLSADKIEIDSDKRKQLERFQNKVADAHLFERWDSLDDLKYKVVASLTKEMRRNPRSGWVRASNTADTEALQKLDDARSENEILRKQLSAVADRDPSAILRRASEIRATFHPSFEKNAPGTLVVLAQFALHPADMSAAHVLRNLGDLLYSAIDEQFLLYEIGRRLPALIGREASASLDGIDQNLRRPVNYGIQRHCLKLLDRLGILKAESVTVGDNRHPQTHWSLNDLGRSVFAHIE
jgi:hypothetical protein